MITPRDKEDVERIIKESGLNDKIAEVIRRNLDIDFLQRYARDSVRVRLTDCFGQEVDFTTIGELDPKILSTAMLLCNFSNWGRISKHDFPRGFMFYDLVRRMLKGEATYLGLQLFNLGEDNLVKRTIVL